jgi:hypothetical protein
VKNGFGEVMDGKIRSGPTPRSTYVVPPDFGPALERAIPRLSTASNGLSFPDSGVAFLKNSGKVLRFRAAWRPA